MTGSEALRAAALAGILLLIWLGQMTLPLLSLLGFIAVCGTVAYSVAAPALGAVAGDVRTIARGECADRTGAHRCVRERTGARRRAGRMGRRRARVRICRRAIRRSQSCCCQASMSRRARLRRGATRCRMIKEGAAFVLHHPLLRPVFITQFIFNTASFLLLARIRALRRAPPRPVSHRRRYNARDVWRRHGGRRAARRRG